MLYVAAGGKGVVEIRLRLINFRLHYGRRRSGGSGRFITVLRERLARQHDFVFRRRGRSGRLAEAGRVLATLVARFETAALLARVIAAA
jgi:hypothetical protein